MRFRFQSPQKQRRKRTQQENLLGNFSGLKEKLSRPVVDTKNPTKTRKKTISTTEIFPLWTPFFSAKEKFCTGAGRCMLSFSQTTFVVTKGPTDGLTKGNLCGKSSPGRGLVVKRPRRVTSQGPKSALRINGPFCLVRLRVGVGAFPPLHKDCPGKFVWTNDPFVCDFQGHSYGPLSRSKHRPNQWTPRLVLVPGQLSASTVTFL